MEEKKPTNPIVATIAGGLAVGLGFGVVGPRVWNELEVSANLMMLVIGVGFIIGAAATFAAVRKKS